MHKKIFIFILLIIFFGCAKPIPKSKSIIILFKTKHFRIYDTAFMKNSGNSTEIEVYKAGSLAFRIYAGSMVCIDSSCMDESEFSAKYLSPYYPQDFLKDLISGNRLEFDGVKRAELKNGFIESAKNSKYDIIHKVNKNEIFFRDKKNRVLIKIRNIL